MLVQRGLAESQAMAQSLVMAGRVTANGAVVVKAGAPVRHDAELYVQPSELFVSRGGVKLEHAVSVFGIDVSGKIAADVGSSTGGFTDCLLKHGATRVYAIDVGKGQLDWRLRRDARVVVKEGVNARYPVELPESVDLITMDVSFISVTKVIPSIAPLLKSEGLLIVLVKPQFEAKRGEVGKGGVITDPTVHAAVLGRFVSWAVGSGFRVKGLVSSPIEGASGNREFFVLLNRSPQLG